MMFDLINRMKIPLPTDENGFTGRECPADGCKGYFKIKSGTGITEEGYDKCFCPYCGIESTQDQFFTKEQISYIESIALKEVEKVIRGEVKKWDRNLQRSNRNSFLRLRVDYKNTNYPLAHYAERELETRLVCENCGLEYAVFGKFTYCPDCGVDNTLQILSANLDLVRKLLSQVKNEENPDFREYLVQNALEDIVSGFDSFGRNCLKLLTKGTEKSGVQVSFQNLVNSREIILHEFGYDIQAGLNAEDWSKVHRNFQKRHLVSHNDGIVDQVYLQLTNDSNAELGRKIILRLDDVDELIALIKKIAEGLKSGLLSWKSSIKEGGQNG